MRLALYNTCLLLYLAKTSPELYVTIAIPLCIDIIKGNSIVENAGNENIKSSGCVLDLTPQVDSSQKRNYSNCYFFFFFLQEG